MYIIEQDYTDFNGNKKHGKYRFNLTKSEIMKIASVDGEYALVDLFEEMREKSKGRQIMNFFEELILSSYGEISLDGNVFSKSEEIKNNFRNSAAYNDIFFKIVTDASAAAAFLNGVMPDEMMDDLVGILEDNPDGVSDDMKDYVQPLLELRKK